MVRKRLGLVALFLLAWNGLVSLWDWATRINGLDPYFGVKQNTFGGHALNIALSPPIFFALALIFGLLWCFEPRLSGRLSSLKPGRASTEDDDRQPALKVAQDDLQLTRKQRDDARLEAAALRAQLAFPRFVAIIQEILVPDPPTKPHLHCVVVMTIVNNGAPSVAQSYKIFARSAYGTDIKAEVVYPKQGFRLVLNDGKDCINYLEEHYLMKRTNTIAVERGTPVSGVLPCVFHDIATDKEINYASLKVQFVDGIGDANGNIQVWESNPLEGLQYANVKKPEKRVGLPSIQPIVKPPDNG